MTTLTGMARGKKSPQKKTPAASPARADAVAAAAAAASQAAAALGMAAQPTAESVESALAAGCAALAAGAFEAAAEALRCGLRAAKGLAKEASPAAARVHEARLALARTEAARGCPAAARKAYKSALTRYFPTATLQSVSRPMGWREEGRLMGWSPKRNWTGCALASQATHARLCNCPCSSPSLTCLRDPYASSALLLWLRTTWLPQQRQRGCGW